MVTVKVNAPTGTIILDRPDRCNALHRAMIADLTEAFDDLRQEKKVRGIVLTGSGPHFCAGQDLKELQQTSVDPSPLEQWYADAEALKTLFDAMLQLPKPIVAAVDGAAMGAGFGLVLASDLVVASHRSTFSIPSPRLGLVSGLVVPLLCFRAGASVASQLAIGGNELTAASARELGLVHHVVDSEQVWVRANTWIESISHGAAESIQLTKRVLNEMVGESLSTLLSNGAAATATAMTTEAAKEGLDAFANKRSPNFPR